MRGDEKYWPELPQRPATPPLPPPPASGRDVSQRSTVDVTGATEALVVGPHDVLIIAYPEDTDMSDLYAIRQRLLDSDLRPGQILLIAGAEKIVKVEGDDSGRPYARPRPAMTGSIVDGETSYQCAACHAPIERGARCQRCGRGWLVEEVPQ